MIPTASASILVATARTSIFLWSIGASMTSTTSSSFHSRTASIIILPPMKPSRMNAIQWSMLVIYFWNWLPRSQPTNGINACFLFSFLIPSPLQTETAKASIESPTPNKNSSITSAITKSPFPFFLRKYLNTQKDSRMQQNSTDVQKRGMYCFAAYMSLIH